MAEAVAHPHLRNSNRRITLTPDILYLRTVSSGWFLLPSCKRFAHSGQKWSQKQVSDSKFLYTPFHYVLDATQDSFDVRPYYMDHPVAQTSIFVAQNDTTGLQVNTYRYSLTKLTTGYRLLVETVKWCLQRNRWFLCSPWLSFVGVSEENRCHLTGNLIGKTAKGERVFEFLIATKFDIDNNDNLWLNNFAMLSAGLRDFAATLTKDFDIVYSVALRWVLTGFHMQSMGCLEHLLCLIALRLSRKKRFAWSLVCLLKTFGLVIAVCLLLRLSGLRTRCVPYLSGECLHKRPWYRLYFLVWCTRKYSTQPDSQQVLQWC